MVADSSESFSPQRPRLYREEYQSHGVRFECCRRTPEAPISPDLLAAVAACDAHPLFRERMVPTCRRPCQSRESSSALYTTIRVTCIHICVYIEYT